MLALSVVGLLYALIDRFILEGWCKIRSLQFIASLAVTCINALTIIPYTCMAYSYAVCRHSKKPSEGDLQHEERNLFPVLNPDFPMEV